MGTLLAEVEREQAVLQRIKSVATIKPSPMFADLCWPPAPTNPFWFWEHPGVEFVSPRRIVVFQRIVGELRYYAGGWGCFLEEGGELGVFNSVCDAMAFADDYLVKDLDFHAIGAARHVMSRRDRTKGQA